LGLSRETSKIIWSRSPGKRDFWRLQVWAVNGRPKSANQRSVGVPPAWFGKRARRPRSREDASLHCRRSLNGTICGPDSHWEKLEVWSGAAGGKLSGPTGVRLVKCYVATLRNDFAGGRSRHSPVGREVQVKFFTLGVCLEVGEVAFSTEGAKVAAASRRSSGKLSEAGRLCHSFTPPLFTL